MTAYEFGDVVLVSFPFTNQAERKSRPAIVVSGKAYQDQHPDVVLVAVTSRVREKPTFGEFKIEKWESAGLFKPSMVKPVFTTVEREMIRKRLGRLAERDRAALRKTIEQVFS